MRNIGDIRKVYQAAELLFDFCSETACPECPIKKLCNKIDKDKPVGQAIMESIRI